MGSYLAALRALRGADHMSTEAARHCEAKSDRAAKVYVDFMMKVMMDEAKGHKQE